MERKMILSLTLLFLVSWGNVLAYDDKDTHPRITERAARDAEFENYLVENLGLRRGLETRLPENSEKSVLYWLRKGATDEDSPMCRSSNHFHDPLKTWSESGMTDDPWWLDLKCHNWKPWFSNITWATGYLSTPPNGTKATFNSNPTYTPNTWDNARFDYYKALTLESKENRDFFLAEAFKALGQSLHLLQDVSVPAHARNDFMAHVWFTGIDSLNPISWFGDAFEYYVELNPRLIVTTSPVYPSFSSPRLTDFWDTDYYLGNNPSVSESLGLSELTNANYFSNSTISNNFPLPTHEFPYPVVNSINSQICEDFAPNSNTKRRYISRKDKNDCPPINEGRKADHFAAISLLNEEDLITQENISYLWLSLDENVHDTYAQELIPRAVGYSAGLLKYFFRGQIDFRQSGMSSNGGIELTIINHSDDALVEGKLELYYDAQNGDQEVRKELTLGRNEVNDLGKDMTFVTSFLAPTDFFPGKENTYTLVYRGKLGNEEGSVIGRYKTLNYYRGCMVVYHKHMRRLFFMSHDQDGNEKNFYIDLSNVIVPSEDTTNWSSADWSTWFRVNYNPLGLSVLEYDGKMGILICNDHYLVKFKVTTPAEGYLDFNIGGEIMEEYLYGNAYGEATSYGNSIYGLGTKRFYKYNFDYLKEWAHTGTDVNQISQGRLVLWEETPGSGDLSTLQWDFTYSVSSNTGGWYINNSLCWATSSSPIPWKAGCLASFLETPWHPQEWSLAGGIVTALNDDFKGVGSRWWDWMEYKGESWEGGPQYRHMYTHPNDPYNYNQVDPPPPVVIDGGSYVGRDPLPTGRLPHGGTVSRMMGAFRKPGTTDGITEHYRIDNKFYFGGLDTIPSNLMDPQTYPFGPAIKELLNARNWLGLDHVPAVQIEEQNNFIGNSTWPMIWHYYLLKGSMKLKDGRVETVYGLVSSRQDEFFTNLSTMEHMWWDADGPLGDIRTLCDFGLIDVNNF
jgi:hypothetical protein